VLFKFNVYFVKIVIALQLFLLKLLFKERNDTKKIIFPRIFSAKIFFYISICIYNNLSIIYNIRYLIISSKHISFNVASKIQ